MEPGVAIIQIDPKVPAGVFADLLAEWRVPFRLVRPDCGDALPTAAAVIILGGRMGVHDEAAHPFLREVKAFMAQALADDIPLLGLCLGGQLLAEVAGGLVSSNRCGQKGLANIELTPAGAVDPLLAGLAARFRAYQWHNDSFTIPLSAVHLATSADCPGQAFRLNRAWGLQFHPEVDRAIVGDWSVDFPEREALIEDFVAAEAEHRQLARQLLDNFLRAAELIA
ncbi:MAG: type 1 glutamine amidotransferase [Desulfuromonadales bacterium]|nr:type 1 glutamine amidotransferase [Desulfuromonadales bacterium]